MEHTTEGRAAELAIRLRQVANQLVTVIQRIDDRSWRQVTTPGTWSISKEAEHIAEALGYHQWIVRLTIGEKVSSRRPSLERGRETSELSQAEMVELIRGRTDEGEALILGLTDEQLDLPTRPPRAREQRLAETIEGVLIDHVYNHRAEIEARLSAIR